MESVRRADKGGLEEAKGSRKWFDEKLLRQHKAEMLA
jgi:hypothetical protein